MEVSDQLHTLNALPPGKEPLVPLNRRLGRPQSHSGHGGERKTSQPLPGIEPWNTDCPAHSLVAILTELSWLLTCHIYMCVCVCVCVFVCVCVCVCVCVVYLFSFVVYFHL
jgi:hypothetical protein